MNTIACTDCGITKTRGSMHIRSVAFTQRAFCCDCWTVRLAVAGVSLADVLESMPLTRRMVEAGIL